MEFSQGEIIKKPKMQELSSLFMTHRLIVMYAPVKFHEYIPYSLGATQQTRNVIVTFSIGFKLVTLNLAFGKRLANVYVLCQHIFDV